MNKCICDICRNNEADKGIKARMNHWINDNGRWIKTDICEECYKKLVRLKEEEPLKEKILDLIPNAFKKYDNEYHQSIYLEGIEDVLHLLYKERIIRESK